MNKFDPNNHHRRSIRLYEYDYSQNGLYFITICTQDKKSIFGTVSNGEMILNPFGEIAYNEWQNTESIRKNVINHEFIIMPNHIHGIIEIRSLRRGELNSPHSNKPHSDHTFSPSTNRGELNSPLPMPMEQLNPKERPRGTSNTIGAIIRGFKTAVTKQLNTMGYNEKVWQRNFYEHIIRNDISFNNIIEYITNNPREWSNDENNI